MQLFIRERTLHFSSLKFVEMCFMTQHMVSFCKKNFHTCLNVYSLLNMSGVLCLTSYSYPLLKLHKIIVLWSPYLDKARNPWPMASILLLFLTLHSACRKLVHSLPLSHWGPSTSIHVAADDIISFIFMAE